MVCRHTKVQQAEILDHFFPINQKGRDYLTQLIMEAFYKEFPEVAKGLEVYSRENNVST